MQISTTFAEMTDLSFLWKLRKAIASPLCEALMKIIAKHV